MKGRSWISFSVRIFFLLLKKMLFSRSFYAVVFLSIVLIFLCISVVFPGSQVRSFGLLRKGGSCAEKIEKTLSADNTSFPCIIYTNIDTMKHDVLTGKIDCAFLLDERLDEAVRGGRAKGSVTYVCSTSTTKGELIKEKLYGIILREMAEEVLVQLSNDGKTFEGESPELTRDLLEKNREYLAGGGTLQVRYETVRGKGIRSTEQKEGGSKNRTRVICGLLIFACSLAFGRSVFSRENRTIAASMRGNDRSVFLYLNIGTPALLYCLLLELFLSGGALAARIRSGGLGTGDFFSDLSEEFGLRGLWGILILLAYGAVCSLWALLFAMCLRKEDLYLFGSVSAVLLCLVSASGLLGISSAVPALNAIKYLFPLTYLRMI